MPSKNIIQQEIIKSISRELLIPIATIKKTTDYLHKIIPTENNSKIHCQLNIIQQQIDTSNKIITDLLEFVRNQSPEQTKVAIREIVDEALSFVNLPPTVEVILDFSQLLPCLWVDRYQLKHALLNLIKHSLAGMISGGKLTFSAKTVNNKAIAKQAKIKSNKKNSKIDNSYLLLTFSDTGIGIPLSPNPRVAQPLFYTKSLSTDLNVIIARYLIEVNGGKIIIRSIAGFGTTFLLYLPCLLSEASTEMCFSYENLKSK